MVSGVIPPDCISSVIFFFCLEDNIFLIGVTIVCLHQVISSIITYFNPPDNYTGNPLVIAVMQLFNLRIFREVWECSNNGTTSS